MHPHIHHSGSAQLRFDNVSVHHYTRPSWLGGKPFVALNKLSLNIDQQSLAIVGPSGAGKSTLIELLFGLRHISEGEVYLCEQPLSQISPRQRRQLCRHIQLIPQEPHTSLNPYYTVRDILTEPQESLGMTEGSEARVLKALADVNLSTTLLDHTSSQLSLGQAQRVAIARALVVEPCVLVADEPTSSLDPISRQHIVDLLKHLQKQRDMRLLLVTHDLNAAKALCDDILVLDKGVAVEYGAASQVFDRPSHPTSQALVNMQIPSHAIAI
ncbi:ATP-binding cassette domain-containing protein [Photobacterium sp. ZSDE20]|uniref:ATP-binding cassette domain-containing protein n=1 Tax=Photobacterium pectinilyticum TaxID=2906793 RepID=A0ABT1N8J3_9GAMM|nr:ABC transporter ATP-binding protein [Photobacterium sp. ZSDE20]MCQ1061043.1 ATP-binding cassette domain-containing protein [Photobacterium sp. ZSDE20]MDD1829091.1 ATP-binding cassette domain-containing protein [Photobacterium sp. ZSDE20]